MNDLKGIESSNGSLGQDCLWCGYGYCNEKKKENSRVFILMGDGECYEGSVWKLQ